MKQLEEYKAFQYVAWILIFGFAFFVGKMALDAQETIASYETPHAAKTQAQYELLQ